MNKIHSRFNQAIKNGPGFGKGWHLIWGGELYPTVILIHSTTRIIKQLTKEEKLYLKISNLDTEIKADGINQWQYRIYSYDNKEPYQKPDMYWTLDFIEVGRQHEQT